MKLKSKLILASVFAAIAATSSVRADSVDVSDQALTIALTTKAAAPGTFEVDPDTGKLTKTPAFQSQVDTLDKNGNVVKSVSTTATKAVMAKYGNKELLESNKELLGGTISGWSIVVSDASGSVVAVKKGKDDVGLNSSIMRSNLVEFGTSVDTVVTKYDSGEYMGQESTRTKTLTDEGLYALNVSTPTLYFRAICPGIQPYKTMAYYTNPEDKFYQELAYIPGAGKITVFGIASTFAYDNSVSAIVGGTVTLAAATGKLVKD